MTRSRGRSVISILLVAAGMLTIFAQPAAAVSSKVLFVNGNGSGCLGDSGLQTQMASQPGVGRVDAVDATAATPSVAALDPYDEVVAHSDCSGFLDATALGNNLADFVDHGGVVVEYAYTNQNNPGNMLDGRWQSGGYSPYVPGSNVNNSVSLGTFDAASPLMAGVSNLVSSGCNTDTTLAPGATRVAKWNNDQEAVAVKARVVSVTAGIDDTSCTWSGDYARLTRNALSLEKPPSGTVISKKKIVRKKRKAQFEFSASGKVSDFECALTRTKKAKKRGKKSAASFSSCSSPKTYKKLRPGKYTLQVRATNAGGPDPVPATKKFKI